MKKRKKNPYNWSTRCNAGNDLKINNFSFFYSIIRGPT